MNQRSGKSSSNYDDDKACEKRIGERNIFMLSLTSLLFGGTNLFFIFIIIPILRFEVTPLIEVGIKAAWFLFPLIAVVLVACAAVLVTKREISGKLKSLVFVAAGVAGGSCIPLVLYAMAIFAGYLQHTGM